MLERPRESRRGMLNKVGERARVGGESGGAVKTSSVWTSVTKELYVFHTSCRSSNGRDIGTLAET